MNHNTLLSDLANHLRSTRDRVVWEDMQLGPVGSPRPDVYTIPKSFTRFIPLAYEIKISIADFRRDVTSGKWQSYLQYAAGVTFAVPAGLISKADVPAGCGLMVRGDEGWRALKAPTLKHIDTLDRKVWLKLIMDGISRQVDRCRSEPRTANHYRIEKEVRSKYGDRIAGLLSDLSTAESRITYEIAQAQAQAEVHAERRKKQEAKERAEILRSREQIDSARMMLAKVLGLDPCASVWDIAYGLQRAADRIDRDHEVKRLTRKLENIKSAFEEGLETPFRSCEVL